MEEFSFTPDAVQDSVTPNDVSEFSFTPDEIQPDLTKVGAQNIFSLDGSNTNAAKKLNLVNRSWVEKFAQSDLGKFGETQSKAVVRGLFDITGSLGTMIRFYGDNMILQKGAFGLDDKTIDRINTFGRGWQKFGSSIKKGSDFVLNSKTLELDRDIFAGDIIDNPSVTRVSSAIMSAAPSLLSMVGIARATGSAGLAYFIMGGVDSASVYEKAKEKGKTQEEANLLYTSSQAGTALIDRMLSPLEKIMGNSPSTIWKKISQKIASGLSEGSAEGAQTVWQNAVKKYGIDDMQALMDGVIEAAIGGFGSGALAAGTFNTAAERLKEKGATNRDIENISQAAIDYVQKHPDEINNIAFQQLNKGLDEFDKFVETHKGTPEAQKAQQIKADLNEVYNKVFDRIKISDTDKVAAAQAKVVQGVALWGSQELGISPLEYFEQRFPRIERVAYRDFARRLNEAKRAGEVAEINLYEALKNPALLKGQKVKDTRQSLTQFLKQNGGLKDFGGELKAMDADKQVIGLINNKNGRNLDDMALAAWEAGYFPQSSERPMVNDLLDAIGEELGGRKRYNEEAPYSLEDEVNQLAEDLDRINIDWRNMEAPEIEMAVDAYMERQRAYNEEMGQEDIGSDELPWFQGQIAENGRNVELTINSQEEMQGLSDEDFKNKMLDTLKSFKGNKIFNQSLNGDIEIRTSSIKKYKSFFADKNKRLIVPYIPELLGKARFVVTEQPYNKRETSIKAYYKADLPINIDEDNYNVHLTVREDQYGNFFWDAQVKGNLQKTTPATNPGGLEVNTRRTVSATNPSVDGLQSPSADPATNPGVKGLTSELSEDGLNITQTSENVNNTNYQFAGERAQTAALDDLSKAKELEVKGVDNEEIRKQTGWFKWIDNKWRYEISDKEAKFSLAGLNGKLGGKLSKFLKHPKLYNAYPNLRKTYISLTAKENEMGYYNPQYDIIYLNKNLDESQLKDVILHEVQHAIQFHEGFAIGSSGKNQSFRDYQRYAGEIEARNTQVRANMNDAERRAVSPESTQDIDSLEAIVVFDDNSIAAYMPDNQIYRGPKGAFSQRIDRRAVISLFERADASTFMHETAHFFFEELKAFAPTSEKSAKMLKTVNDWLGSDGASYTVEQTEQFARGFEQYLREGKAPSSYLKRVFDAFMNWMRNLYKTAKELNVKLNDEVRGVYGEILGGADLDRYMDVPVAEVLGQTKRYWKAKREAMDDIYKQNVDAKKASARLFKRGRETMQNVYTDMRNYLSDAIVPLEEEIKQISPELYNMNRRLEIDKLQKTSAYYKRIKGFVDGMQKMDAPDFYTFDLALKNRDVDTVQRLLEKYTLTDEFAEVRNILDDLREQMIDVGVDVAYMPDYFPRKIKDADGLLDYVEQEFGGRPEYSIIQKMIEEKRKDGRIRTKEDEAQIVNSLIRGYAGGISIAQIGNVKERSIDVVDQYMNRFYKVSTDALTDYISGAVQMIENKKYFGRETKELQNLRKMVANRETTIADYKAMEPKEAKWKEIKTRNYKIGAVEAQIRNTYDKDVKAELQERKTKLEAEVEFLRNRQAEQVKEIAINRMEVELAQVKKEVDELADSKIENSVGNLLLEMAEQGKISHTQELRLKELLLARFSNQGLGNEFLRLLRDGGYIWTLGNFESAITQFGDLGTSAYKNGLWNTAFEYVKAWQGKSEITINDLGLEKIIQDGGYADTSAWSRALDKVLKYTGFEKMDKIAKQTLVNSAVRKARADAKAESPELEAYLRHEFGEKWVDVKEDLKTGTVTDEIMEYAMFQLLDVQPITIDQMPRYYAEGGKKRLFYMMKSYFIKQLNEYRKICFEMAKSNPRKAVVDMTRLTVYLMLFNAGADVLKDLLFGRSVNVPDSLVDNIFIGGSINRYQAMSVKREGLFKTLQKQLLFPVMMDELIVDILSNKEVKDWNTWKNVPLVGRPYYWWFGGGHLKEKKRTRRRLVD